MKTFENEIERKLPQLVVTYGGNKNETQKVNIRGQKAL